MATDAADACNQVFMDLPRCVVRQPDDASWTVIAQSGFHDSPIHWMNAGRTHARRAPGGRCARRPERFIRGLREKPAFRAVFHLVVNTRRPTMQAGCQPSIRGENV
jgi:hypothetical protein